VWCLERASEGYYYYYNISQSSHGNFVDKVDGESRQQWKFCEDGSIDFISSSLVVSQAKMSVVPDAVPGRRISD
jgi:hypothetical protein